MIFHQAIRYEERIPAVRPAACSGDLGLVSEKKSSKGFANSKKEARRGIRVDAFFEARIRWRDQRISRFEQDGVAKATSDWIRPAGHIQTPAGVFKTCPVPFSVNALLPKMGLPVFSGNPWTQTSISIRRCGSAGCKPACARAAKIKGILIIEGIYFGASGRYSTVSRISRAAIDESTLMGESMRLSVP